MKIGVIGGGVVGRATAHAFRDSHEIRIWDIVPERCTTPSILQTLESDIIFICLPTPQKSYSLECDTTTIHSFFSCLAEVNSHRNFVLRSTVPIGFTKKLRERYNLLNLVHSPEFLTARMSLSDAMCPARNIIGLPGWYKAAFEWDNNAAYYVLKRVYYDRWPHVPIHVMTSDESEAVKLFQNGFSAVKIAYFNEVRCLADKLGMDWDTVLNALLAGGWINPMHTQVPGPDGKRGFGGACLPKDLANLMQCIQDANLDSWMTSAANSRNKWDRGDK